jgi:hypothetical protein
MNLLCRSVAEIDCPKRARSPNDEGESHVAKKARTAKSNVTTDLAKDEASDDQEQAEANPTAQTTSHVTDTFEDEEAEVTRPAHTSEADSLEDKPFPAPSQGTCRKPE